MTELTLPPTLTVDDLRTQAEQVAVARRWLEIHDATVQAKEAALLATLTADYERQAEARNAAQVEEEKLRAMALAYYQSTGQKSPLGKAVVVTTSEKLRYEIAAATEWAMANAPVAITKPMLNSKVFEKVVGAMEVLPPCVVAEEVCAVRLATDLAAALGTTQERAA